MTSAPAIGFEYRPSRLLPFALIVVALLAIMAVLLCGLPAWMKLVLIVSVVLSTWRAIGSTTATPVTAAGWSAEGGWTIHLDSHQDLPAVLVSFRVLGAFVLLRLRSPERKTWTLLLGPDNSDSDIRRRLRMRLAVLQPDTTGASG